MSCLLNYKGRRFEAYIEGEFTEGVIQTARSAVYLCQDTKDGSRCRDTMGFEYSWYVGIGSDSDLRSHDVQELKILDYE